jgi:Ca2+-binding EF-hand superfamily protein
MNVNDLMNMNDMYYVGNIIDVDGDGWVSKSEARQILDELGMGEEGYGDESPAEYKRMMDEVKSNNNQ